MQTFNRNAARLEKLHCFGIQEFDKSRVEFLLFVLWYTKDACSQIAAMKCGYHYHCVARLAAAIVAVAMLRFKMCFWERLPGFDGANMDHPLLALLHRSRNRLKMLTCGYDAASYFF